MKTTIVLADDHDLVRKSVAALLSDEPDFEVIGECRNGRELLNMIERLRPDVAIVDVAMPEMNGIEAATRIKEMGGMIRVIILSSYIDEVYLEGALKAGTAGYIVKSGVADDLIRAIRVGTRRHPYFSPAVAEIAEGLPRPRKRYPPSRQPTPNSLSPRQREVLQLIGEGYSTADIAARLGITEATAKDHRKHIKQKLNIHNIAGLTRYAISKRIVRADSSMAPEYP